MNMNMGLPSRARRVDTVDTIGVCALQTGRGARSTCLLRQAADAALAFHDISFAVGS